MIYHSVSVWHALEEDIDGLQLLNGFSTQARSVQYGATLTVRRKLMGSILCDTLFS